jgi:ketosteroid isomerase-like protein
VAQERSGPAAIARRYLAAIEQGLTGDAFAALFTPDFVQEELPNRLSPNGSTRDLAGILEAAERGRRAISSQRYLVLGQVANGRDIALEVEWTGTLAAPLGDLPAGKTLRARFAVFLETRDGRIARQRNYDCFYPF